MDAQTQDPAAFGSDLAVAALHEERILDEGHATGGSSAAWPTRSA